MHPGLRALCRLVTRRMASKGGNHLGSYPFLAMSTGSPPLSPFIISGGMLIAACLAVETTMALAKSR